VEVKKKRTFALPVPDPVQFRGKPLRLFLSAVTQYLRQLTAYVGAVDGAKPPMIFVTTPVGGIAAFSGATPGSGTCTVLSRTGTLSDTVTVYNRHTVAFGASKIGLAVLIGNEYWITTEQCS
jgi:hypothetical protein